MIYFKNELTTLMIMDEQPRILKAKDMDTDLKGANNFNNYNNNMNRSRPSSGAAMCGRVRWKDKIINNLQMERD